jgi:hypothetical protein
MQVYVENRKKKLFVFILLFFSLFSYYNNLTEMDRKKAFEQQANITLSEEDAVAGKL